MVDQFQAQYAATGPVTQLCPSTALANSLFVVLFLGGLGVILAAAVYSRRSPRPKYLTIAFLIPPALAGVYLFVLQDTTNDAREMILRFAGNAKMSSGLLVAIDGRPLEDTEQILGLVERMQYIHGHGSRTLDGVVVTMMARTENGSEAITLELKRDSSVAGEVWVFLPECGSSAMNDIGRIRGVDMKPLIDFARHRVPTEPPERAAPLRLPARNAR